MKQNYVLFVLIALAVASAYFNIQKDPSVVSAYVQTDYGNGKVVTERVR